MGKLESLAFQRGVKFENGAAIFPDKESAQTFLAHAESKDIKAYISRLDIWSGVETRTEKDWLYRVVEVSDSKDVQSGD